MTDRIYNPQTKQLAELLVGHSVRKVSDDTLELDDGTQLSISGNEGCGGCSSGWYELAELNECPNMITRVTQKNEYDPKDDEWGDSGDQTYLIFVYAENKKIKLAQVDGSDGNGCYGTGFSIQVRPASA